MAKRADATEEYSFDELQKSWPTVPPRGGRYSRGSWAPSWGAACWRSFPGQPKPTAAIIGVVAASVGVSGPRPPRREGSVGVLL
jgi:hypothetical protein